MVRIAHISDSHLGCDMFQLIERREDVRRCFQKAVMAAMKYSPDMIVHTGDLFDTAFPDNEDLVCVNKTLSNLKDTKFYVVPGNHDVPFHYRREAGPIRVLESSGLAISTENQDYRKITEVFDGKSIEIHLLAWTSPRRFERHLHNIKRDKTIAVLLTHSNQATDQKLPKSFNYIGLGHRHKFSLDEKRNIGIPGSTCIVDWKRDSKENRKLIVMDIDNESIHYQKEKLRDVREFKIIKNLNITNMSADDAYYEIKKRIDTLSIKKLNQPIIILEVDGQISKNTEDEINRFELIEYGTKKYNPLIFHIETKWVCKDSSNITLTRPLNIISSVKEYLTQMGEGHDPHLMRELEKIVRDLNA